MQQEPPITLENFLLANRGGCPDFNRFEGPTWITLWKIACEGIAHRPNGLKFDDRVVSLHAGYGGASGIRMIVNCHEPDKHGIMYAVKVDRNWDVVASLSKGCIFQDTWWKSVAFESDLVRDYLNKGY